MPNLHQQDHIIKLLGMLWALPKIRGALFTITKNSTQWVCCVHTWCGPFTKLAMWHWFIYATFLYLYLKMWHCPIYGCVVLCSLPNKLKCKMFVPLFHHTTNPLILSLFPRPVFSLPWSPLYKIWVSESQGSYPMAHIQLGSISLSSF